MFELVVVLGAIAGAAISGRGFLATVLLAIAFRELSVAGPGQMWVDIACDPSRATEILDVELATRN